MKKILFKAFTLIELLVVIAIIGILSGLIVVAMGGMTQKATIAKTQIFSNSLRNSLMLNLVSEWKLDNNLNDSWSGGNNGTWTGPTAPNTAINYRPEAECVSGQCLDFDGVDDRVDFSFVPGILTTNKYTIAGWFKKTSSSDTTIINISDSPTNRNGITFDTGYISCSYYNGTAYTKASSLVTVSLNLWHHVACINTSGNLSLYVDGGLATTGTSGMGLGASQNRIGYNSNAGSYFTGQIDEIRVFNAAMPTSQIKEQYYAGLNSLLASGQINREDYQDRLVGIK